MTRKPWTIVLWRQDPWGPGAAGRWPRTGCAVFASWRDALAWMNAHPNRTGFSVTDVVSGDPSEYGGAPDDWVAAPHTVEVHEGVEQCTQTYFPS